MTYFLFTIYYVTISKYNMFKQLLTFFSKTTEAIVVKFRLKYDQTPGFQNYKFGLGQESKMAAVTNNCKNIKINFFSGTIRYKVVEFVLKKLFTYFEMLIVPHALHCVDSSIFIFYLI